MYNHVLTLDPMYNFFHLKISKLLASNRNTALLSNLGCGFYLPGFEKFYISSEIKKIKLANISSSDLRYYRSIVSETPFHYKSVVDKIEQRALSDSEIAYFVKYLVFLDEFLDRQEVSIVIMHNDLRWNHALAVRLLRDKGIKYLVTEQGVIRPYTTILDPKGVNAFSSILEQFDKYRAGKITPSTVDKKTVIHTHDSFLSKSMFLGFLIYSSFGRVLRKNARYSHNNYSFYRYFKRHIRSLIVGNPSKQTKSTYSPQSPAKTIFFPMQLSMDTQLLVHSDFDSFRTVLSRVSEICFMNDDVELIVKKHPNDLSKYQVKGVKWVEGNTKELIAQSDAVITVNSSVGYEVLATNKPLFVLGRAAYCLPGVAREIDINSFGAVLREDLSTWQYYVSVEERNEFMKFITEYYSIVGAGFSYNDDDICRVLKNFGLI